MPSRGFSGIDRARHSQHQGAKRGIKAIQVSDSDSNKGVRRSQVEAKKPRPVPRNYHDSSLDHEDDLDDVTKCANAMARLFKEVDRLAELGVTVSVQIGQG